MIELVQIDVPNDTELADDVAVLTLWEDVQACLSNESTVFIVGGDSLNQFRVSVDAIQVIRFLKAEIDRHKSLAPYVEPPRAYEDMNLALRIEPSGAPDSSAAFPSDRFVEQLFLACNLAVPGSCAFTRSKAIVRLDPALMAAAFHLGRIPTDDSYEATLWPDLEPVSFREAWKWLQDDFSYDIEVATTPSQMTVFALLSLATRYPDDVDNILMVSRALEAIFGRDVQKDITKTIDDRIASRFGRPAGFPRWFREFYDLRSRLIHGDKKLLRPGLTHPTSLLAQEVILEHDGPLAQGVRVLLASVYQMIRLNQRDLNK